MKRVGDNPCNEALSPPSRSVLIVLNFCEKTPRKTNQKMFSCIVSALRPFFKSLLIPLQTPPQRPAAGKGHTARLMAA